jgi:hypothetical protein
LGVPRHIGNILHLVRSRLTSQAGYECAAARPLRLSGYLPHSSLWK